jgi:hypothetical protein
MPKISFFFVAIDSIICKLCDNYCMLLEVYGLMVYLQDIVYAYRPYMWLL